MLNGFRCHRNRGKSHYQIAMESLAKLVKHSTISSALMRLCVKGHGLGREIKLRQEEAISLRESVDRDTIFTGRFFLDSCNEEIWTTYRSAFADTIQTVIEDAEGICRHEFELLGTTFSYFRQPIEWHLDPVSGYRWPKKFFSELKRGEKGPQGSDVKLPWELSRMQHLPTLGKAYRLTKDERYAREIVEQIRHWLDDNPCPYGVNWTCPMDVAIRIMNITWAYLFVRDATAVTNEFRSRLATSVFQHGQFITFNLEFGLRTDGSIINGNHYLTNIVGLLHLGLLCPEIENADQWKSCGIKALVEEMDRQVHSDGVDFESSVAYHRLALELFTAGALLCRANGLTLPDRFWRRLEQMYEFVLFVTRPDGKAPLVGDADDGRLYILSDYRNWERRDFRYLLSTGAVLFHRSDMKTHAGRLSEEAFWLLGPSAISDFADLEDAQGDLKSKAFREAGLYIIRHGDRYLLASCGEVGTEGIGNHKHNDLLSFELYAGDKAFIVDPGAYVYTRDPAWRNLFRSTKYHNTVVVDDQEQNRLIPAQIFRIVPDSTVVVHEWRSTPESDRLDAEHTGYTKLEQPVRHRRTFALHKQTGIWELSDVLTGVGKHRADWYFHFDVGIELSRVNDMVFRTHSQGTNLEIAARSETPLAFNITDGWVSRRYGHKLPAKVLSISAEFESMCRMALTMQCI
jgi:hypothetical protein